MKKVILILSVLLSSGCATVLSQRAAMVRDADDKMVSSCEFVGNVTGTSAMTGVVKHIGLSNAVNEARENASSMGATHVLWSLQEGAYWSGGSAAGKAYRCNK